MRRILLCAILLCAMGCATTAAGPPENIVDCKTFLATEHDDRLGQWANTFRRGLESDPGLGRIYWTCVLTLPRIESADIGLGRACQENPDLDFDAAVGAQLKKHFAKCGLTFKPITE